MIVEIDKEANKLDAFDFLELPDMNNQDQRWSSNKKREFNFVFAYDHSAQQYELGAEISELEANSKSHIQQEIGVINSYCKTKISIPFYIIIALFLGAIAFLFISFYISLLIVTFFFWNPIIFLMILLVFVRYAFSVVIFMFSGVNEKYRSRGLKELINNENKNEEFPNISWSYGRDGSWIEVRVCNKK